MFIILSKKKTNYCLMRNIHTQKDNRLCTNLRRMLYYNNKNLHQNDIIHNLTMQFVKL